MMHNLSMFEKNEKKSSGSLPQVFSYQRAKENVKYLFSGWFSEFSLSIKKSDMLFICVICRIIDDITTFRKKNYSTYQLCHHNILYLARSPLVSAFWSHSVLLKIDQYIEYLLIYNLSMFGKIFFLGTVDDDNSSLTISLAIGSLEKYGRMVFKIVSSTGDFETIKNGITSVARLLKQFPF